jgi:hypothetical protein
MIGIPYKDTFAAKGSALYEALQEGDQKKAKAIYEATTERMKQLLQKEKK